MLSKGYRAMPAGLAWCQRSVRHRQRRLCLLILCFVVQNPTSQPKNSLRPSQRSKRPSQTLMLPRRLAMMPRLPFHLEPSSIARRRPPLPRSQRRPSLPTSTTRRRRCLPSQPLLPLRRKQKMRRCALPRRRQQGPARRLRVGLGRPGRRVLRRPGPHPHRR